MIAVDSSVWIDYFRGVSNGPTDRLDDALGQDEVLVGDIVLTEVLQGFRDDHQHRTAREALLALDVVPMLGTHAALRAADAYRALRSRGITVRKTIDVVIASWCLHADVPLLFSDRDFQPFVDHLGLRAA